MSENLFPESAPAPADESCWFTAHCDGGSRGNPGPAAYGAVIEDPQGRVVARLSEFLGSRTNNYAEYQGLLAVLGWAAEHGATRFRVISDSELMVRQMKGAYKVSSPALRPLWEEARRRAAALERFEIRHTLRAGNTEADRLANEAMDRGMGKSSAQPSAPPSAHTDKKLVTERQILDGYVKNGVVHLISGELPDGTFVKVIRE
jgi:ribonuclease HI